jgi:hypothetical protein
MDTTLSLTATEIDGESEIYNRFAPGELLFFTKCGSKKKRLLSVNEV